MESIEQRGEKSFTTNSCLRPMPEVLLEGLCFSLFCACDVQYLHAHRGAFRPGLPGAPLRAHALRAHALRSTRVPGLISSLVAGTQFLCRQARCRRCCSASCGAKSCASGGHGSTTGGPRFCGGPLRGTRALLGKTQRVPNLEIKTVNTLKYVGNCD